MVFGLSFGEFNLGEFGLGKRVSISASENLVSKKKVSVSVSEDFVSVQIFYLNSNPFLFCSYLLDVGKQRLQHRHWHLRSIPEEKKEKGNIWRTSFFWRKRKPEKEKEENIRRWRIFFSGGKENQRRKRGEIFGKDISRILRSLSFGFSLETFANFRRVSVSLSNNLVSGKKSRFWF